MPPTITVTAWGELRTFAINANGTLTPSLADLADERALHALAGKPATKTERRLLILADALASGALAADDAVDAWKTTWRASSATIIARNHPTYIELAVAADDDLAVAYAAYRATPPHLLAAAASTATGAVAHALAGNPNTPQSALDQLADGESTVAFYVAANPSTAPATLVRLAGSEHNFIRRKVAANPNTPIATRLGLRSDTDEQVAYLARQADQAPSAWSPVCASVT